jgi:hypothetical protein
VARPSLAASRHLASIERERALSQKIWGSLVIQPRDARAVYDIAVACGCQFALHSACLNINIPLDLPQSLRNALKLHLGLATKCICELFEREEGA